MFLRGVMRRIARHGNRTALWDSQGGPVTYNALNASAMDLANTISPMLRDGPNGRQPTVAYLAPRDRSYVASQWAAWNSGAIGVPLAENYPANEYEYLLKDSGASVVVAHPSVAANIAPVARELGIPVLPTPSVPNDAPFDASAYADAPASVMTKGRDGAMLVYTSGTTGRPKGVLTTHGMLEAQVGALTSAWGWTPEDHILSVLPLHHVHGVVAVLNCAMVSGAACEMLPRFDAKATWEALARPAHHGPQGPLSLFMAVPTVYAKLLEAYDKADPAVASAWSAALKAPSSRLRLMVSGSAALPEPLAKRWSGVSGHTLLERFGMSEFAMALSNPLHGERRLNSVGMPLPGYEARIVPEALADDAGAAGTQSVDPAFPGPGELQIRGPAVFSEYWGRPDATAESFTPDGWFRTGDCVARDPDGYFRILGRLSADIIKTSGYKVSALDIERVLLEHPLVSEAAVLGVPHPVQGEAVAAVVVLKSGATGEGSLSGGGAGKGHGTLPRELWEGSASLAALCAAQLPGYKVPSAVKAVAEIPRNAMGKVNKKALRAALFQ